MPTSFIFGIVCFSRAFFGHVNACVAGLQATLSPISHARPKRKLHVQALGPSKRLKFQEEYTTDIRQKQEACLKRQLPAMLILFRGVESSSDVWPVCAYHVQFLQARYVFYNFVLIKSLRKSLRTRLDCCNPTLHRRSSSSSIYDHARLTFKSISAN